MSFPAGGVYELLTGQEEKLLNAIRNGILPIDQLISKLSGDRDWSACYSIVIFSVRLSILAVRTQNTSLYQTGIVVLVAGSSNIDWRDALGALAIFEACGKQLTLDFQAEVEAIASMVELEKLRPVLDGYFARADELRTVEAMGHRQLGEGPTLMYRSRE